LCSAPKEGLHENVAKHCDFLVRIPMAGQVLPQRERRGGRDALRVAAPLVRLRK
jgi:hypothetical protein